MGRVLVATLWFGLIWATTAHAAPCVGDEHTVRDAVADANARVVSGDLIGFEREIARLQAEVVCLRKPISPSGAADIHLALGLWHWAHRNDDGAFGSMRAARAADPLRALPDVLFPNGDALRLAFEAALPAVPLTEPAHVPAGRNLWFDGTLTHDRPTDRPSVVQVGGRDGLPALTAVLTPDARIPLPPWVRRTRRDLAITSGTTAAAAIALFAGAWTMHAQFERAPTDDIPGLMRDRNATNGLAVGALISALSAVGTGVAAAALR